jgi:hypothetical protein
MQKHIGKSFAPDKIKVVEQAQFLPPPLMAPPGTYNLWRGFPIEKHAIQDHAVAERGAQELMSLLDDPHLLSWVAHLVQRPGEKPGSAIVTRGRMPLRVLLQIMLGSSMGNLIEHDPTGLPEHTLLLARTVTLDESAQALSDLVLRETVTVKTPRMPARTQPDVTRYWFDCEGEDFPLLKNDRVMVALPYQKVHAHMWDLLRNRDCQRRFFDYLQQVDISEWSPYSRPVTTLFRHLHQRRLTCCERFVYQFVKQRCFESDVIELPLTQMTQEWALDQGKEANKDMARDIRAVLKQDFGLDRRTQSANDMGYIFTLTSDAAEQELVELNVL